MVSARLIGAVGVGESGAAAGGSVAACEGVRAGSGGGRPDTGVGLAGVGGGGLDAVVGVGRGLGSFSTERTFSKPSMPMIFSKILLTYVDSCNPIPDMVS